MSITSLAVFCGSKNGVNGVYANHALQLGKILAENNIGMIYGGGSSGLMGIIADAVMQHNGRVTGIIPHVLVEWERQHRSITELIIADNMHERKKECMNSAMELLFCPVALVRLTNYLKC